MSESQLLIKLLEEEVAALRSVLSELSDKQDLNCYTQWNKAQAISDLLNYIKR